MTPRRLVIAFLLTSLFGSLLLLYDARTATGEILSRYSDHLHHCRATWTFLRVGMEVYRKPFGVTAPLAPYPYDVVPWPEFPVPYPVGMFLVFLPPTLLGKWAPHLGLAVFGKWVVTYLVVLAHGALYVVWRTMERVSTRGAVPLFVGMWLFLTRASLLGFYEGAWLALAALSIGALAARKPAQSLFWFGLCTLVNYRAAAVLPPAVYAAWTLFGSNESRGRKVGAALFAVVAGLLGVWTFWLLLKGSPPATSSSFGAARGSVFPLLLRTKLLVAVGVVTAPILAFTSDLLVGVTVAWLTFLATVHGAHSWHGSMLGVALMLVGVARPTRSVALSRGILAMWFFATLDLGFYHQPFVGIEELLEKIGP